MILKLLIITDKSIPITIFGIIIFVFKLIIFDTKNEIFIIKSNIKIFSKKTIGVNWNLGLFVFIVFWFLLFLKSRLPPFNGFKSYLYIKNLPTGPPRRPPVISPSVAAAIPIAHAFSIPIDSIVFPNASA